MEVQDPVRPVPAAGGARLVRLVAAGLVDSLFLSVAWTLIVLRVADTYGLPAVGLCSAAMLVGVALSAPVAGRVALRLDGRRLLLAATGTEMALRAAVVGLVVLGAPVLLLASCVTAMNLSAWTGYAAMRAEVTAARPGSAALTWYGTLVAAAEAVGVALAALLPMSPVTQDVVLTVVLYCYVVSLVPTALVAHGSSVPRATRAVETGRRSGVLSAPVLAGGLLMLLAGAPSLLFVALTEQLHGRAAVAAAAVTFTVGSLLAPLAAAAVRRRAAGHGATWTLVAAGAVAGWVVAPLSVPMLCVAQLASGLCLTLLEGLLDSATAQREPHRITGALATATAGRALGAAAGTALLPLLLVDVRLDAVAGVAAVVLLGTAAALAVSRSLRPAPDPAVDVPEPGPLAATVA